MQYHKLTPMLLNEVQRLHRQSEQHQRLIDALSARLAALEAAEAPAVK